MTYAAHMWYTYVVIVLMHLNCFVLIYLKCFNIFSVILVYLIYWNYIFSGWYCYMCSFAILSNKHSCKWRMMLDPSTSISHFSNIANCYLLDMRTTISIVSFFFNTHTSYANTGAAKQGPKENAALSVTVLQSYIHFAFLNSSCSSPYLSKGKGSH